MFLGRLQHWAARFFVENIVLGDENQVEENRNVGQSQFQRVARDAAPVALKAGVDDQLKEREDTAGYIEKNLIYAPAGRRLALEVDPYLWNIFDKGRDQLDITDGIYHVNPGPAECVLMSRSNSDQDVQENCQY